MFGGGRKKGPIHDPKSERGRGGIGLQETEWGEMGERGKRERGGERGDREEREEGWKERGGMEREEERERGTTHPSRYIADQPKAKQNHSIGYVIWGPSGISRGRQLLLSLPL